MGTTNFDVVEANDVSVGGVSIAGVAGLSAAECAALEALTLTCSGGTMAAPAAEAADARSVAVQLNNMLGDAMTTRAVVHGFVSTDATGDTPGDGSSTIVVTAGTDGKVIATDESGFVAISEVDGDLDLVLTDTADAAQTVYVHIVTPTGALISSAAIAFADDTP